MKKEVLTNFERVSKNDLVLLLGVPLFFNTALQNELQKKEAQIVYMHPIDYKSESLNFSQYIKYEVGSEEGICALLLNYFISNARPDIQAFIDDLDIGYLSAESSLGEEELEEVLEKSQTANQTFIVVGEDILNHEKAENIINMLSALNQQSDVQLIIQNGCSKAVENINNCSGTEIEEVEELDSFDGLVICKNDAISNNQLLGGVSFSKIAKISDGADVLIKFDNQTLQRVFKIDTNLQGTIALCSSEGIESLSYSYKQVKIEKVDE